MHVISNNELILNKISGIQHANYYLSYNTPWSSHSFLCGAQCDSDTLLKCLTLTSELLRKMKPQKLPSNLQMLCETLVCVCACVRACVHACMSVCVRCMCVHAYVRVRTMSLWPAQIRSKSTQLWQSYTFTEVSSILTCGQASPFSS